MRSFSWRKRCVVKGVRKTKLVALWLVDFDKYEVDWKNLFTKDTDIEMWAKFFNRGI